MWTLPAAAGSAGVPPSPGSLGCTGKPGLQRPSPVPRVVGESSHLVLGGQAGHGGGPGLAFHGEVVLTVRVAVSAHLSHLHRLRGRWRGQVSPGAAWPGDPGVEGRAGLGAKGTVGSWRYLRVGLAIGHVGGGAPLRAPCARLLEHLLGPLGHPGRALFHATFVSHPVWGTWTRVMVGTLVAFAPGTQHPCSPAFWPRGTLTILLLGPAVWRGGRSGQAPLPVLEMGAPCAGT